MTRSSIVFICSALLIVICCSPTNAAAAALLLAGPFGRGSHRGGSSNNNNMNNNGSGQQQEYHASMNNNNEPAISSIPDIDFSTSCQDNDDDNDEYGSPSVVNANIIKWKKVRTVHDTKNGGKIRSVPTFLPGQVIATRRCTTILRDECHSKWGLVALC